MRGPYGTRWADIDEPAEVVEAEDRAFWAALGIWSVQNSMRPPEPDEMPGQPWEPGPGSLRAKVIELYLAMNEAERTIRSTWRGNLLWHLAVFWGRLRRRFGASIGRQG